MKFYTTKGAPNSRRVSIFLAEKGLAIAAEQIDLGRMDHKTTAYSAINPLRQTPALILDDGTILTESVALCRYFEEVQPDPPLFGSSPLERAQIEMWQRRMELQFLLNVANVFRHTHPFMAEMEVPQIAAVADASRPKVQAFLALLDAELANRRYIVGDSFSIADITGLVSVEFMRPARITIPPAFLNVQRWFADISARASARG